MHQNLDMFKAYDIRTKSNKLTDEVLSALASAIAAYFKDDLKVSSAVIARDARSEGPRVMDALISSLTGLGIEVFYNPDEISTCQFYYMCMKKRNSAGIMITASHNPAEYIGCKLVAPYLEPIAMGTGPFGGLDRIKERYLEDTFAEDTEKAEKHIYRCMEEYVDYSLRLAGIKEGDLSGMRIFAEFFSGSAGKEFRYAFEKAGTDLTLSNEAPDGTFPNGAPNPMIESSMKPARDKMRKGSFDIGFCFDGDGDRMDIMMEDGTQLLPSLNFSLILNELKKIAPGSDKCYLDIKAMPLSLVKIRKSGFIPHVIRNGHSFIKDKLRSNKEKGFFSAVEESAHYYMNLPYEDEGSASAENTLLVALLTAKTYRLCRDGYIEAFAIQNSIFRIREWSLFYNQPDAIANVLQDVKKALIERGMLEVNEMEDGTDLDASIFRLSLPESFQSPLEMPSEWAQVTQKISRSEDAITRWEVISSSRELTEELDALIKSITDGYAESGVAHY